ncbi:unnamed protein product, partial [Sphenostylis stenocarpa]
MNVDMSYINRHEDSPDRKRHPKRGGTWDRWVTLVSGLFVCVVRKEEDSMIIRSPEPEVKILVDRDPIKTSFEEWAKPGHFSRTIAKGPDTTTWIWNLHADAHDFDSHTNNLEEISRKVFSAHFGQLSIIFLWLSGMHFHGARFSNYEAWLSDPTHIRPSAQVVWPIVGQEIVANSKEGGYKMKKMRKKGNQVIKVKR